VSENTTNGKNRYAGDEVVATRVDEPEVRREERGPTNVAEQLGIEVHSQLHVGGDDSPHEHHRGGRHDATDPSGVEVAEVAPHVPRGLAHKQSGDHEAADDEEDVHPDVPALEAGDASVREDHEHNRDRAQSLDVGAEEPLRRTLHRVEVGGRCLGG
jgi:hypothetical protein